MDKKENDDGHKHCGHQSNQINDDGILSAKEVHSLMDNKLR